MNLFYLFAKTMLQNTNNESFSSATLRSPAEPPRQIKTTVRYKLPQDIITARYNHRKI